MVRVALQKTFIRKIEYCRRLAFVPMIHSALLVRNQTPTIKLSGNSILNLGLYLPHAGGDVYVAFSNFTTTGNALTLLDLVYSQFLLTICES